MWVGVSKVDIELNSWEISFVKYFSKRFTGVETLIGDPLDLSMSGGVDGEKLCLELV